MSGLTPRAMPGGSAAGRGTTATAGAVLGLALLTAGLLGAAAHAAAPPAVWQYLNGSFGAGSQADYASSPARSFAPQRPITPPSP